MILQVTGGKLLSSPLSRGGSVQLPSSKLSWSLPDFLPHFTSSYNPPSISVLVSHLPLIQSHFLPPPTHLLENGEAPDMVVHVLKLPFVDLVQQPHLPPRVGDPSPSSSQTCLKLLSSPPPDQESSAPRSPTSLTCCS